MKDYQPQKARKVIADLSARHRKLSDGLAAHRIEELWMQLYAPHARRYTASVAFSAGHLTIGISHDAWKNELMLTRTAIRERLNSLLGDSVTISDIRFL